LKWVWYDESGAPQSTRLDASKRGRASLISGAMFIGENGRFIIAATSSNCPRKNSLMGSLWRWILSLSTVAKPVKDYGL